jgi:hypothetical protein
VRFVYLLPLHACAHHYCISEGLVVLRDHTNRICGVAATVYRREQSPWRFGRKLDRKTKGSNSGETISETHLCVGKVRDIHGVTWPGPWPLWRLPCEGLQWGLEGSKELLDTSVKITKSSMGVRISTTLYLPHLYYALRLCDLHS